ncbi:MAG: serine/threonine protein kinase [Bacilli bacterium]|nr:serine/threonine protein kinase [Bacilli bacterium]
MALKIGTIIDGRYRIDARIGHGGMAEVYEATDVINKRIVAIKFIREDVMQNPINLRRFENEAMIAASLNHPNIIKVYNHGVYDGRPYIANEYIKGQTLKDVLDFRGSLSIEEALSVMIQLSNTLSYAHQHNIIHRDVKPQNMYLLADGTLKLGDFGIAQADGFNDNLTSTGDIVGSVYYLAPEISKGGVATAQSDIYSAGVTFFELITGHVPFMKDNAVNIAVAHIKEKFPSPKKYLPSCPKEIERIIFKCTKKSLRERYKTMDDLYEDLVNLKNNPSLYKDKRGILAKIFGFK